MLSSRSGILAKAMNTVEMQWVGYDQVVCRSNDAVIIKRVVILRHNKLKRFSRTFQPALNKTLLHATTTPQ